MAAYTPPAQPFGLTRGGRGMPRERMAAWIFGVAVLALILVVGLLLFG